MCSECFILCIINFNYDASDVLVNYIMAKQSGCSVSVESLYQNHLALPIDAKIQGC